METSRSAFLTEYGFTPEEFAQTSLTWEALDDIRRHHELRMGELKNVATLFANILQGVHRVHSVRFRVKSPEHLVAKIIRKRIAQPERIITLQNYRTELTDLIGLRALHLFKGDWRPIHDFITTHFDLPEQPVAYYRLGDPPELLAQFSDTICKTEVHEAGYRSVHYIVRSTPMLDAHSIELQVRTLFEEGWAEIDHIVRYPRKSDDDAVSSFLRLFNNTAGTADEMGTFLMQLCTRLVEDQTARTDSDRKRIAAETKLKETLSRVKISDQERETLRNQIDALQRANSVQLRVPLGTLEIMNSALLGPNLSSAYTSPEKKCPNGHLIYGNSTVIQINCPECGAPLFQ